MSENTGLIAAENTGLIDVENAEIAAAAMAVSGLAMNEIWTDKAQFNQLLRAATMLSKAAIIPQNYQNRPQDCFVALEMASRMNISPMIVMQNMYVVKNKPCWSGQACMMLIGNCGKFISGS